MITIFWILIFILSLGALMKGSDFLIASSERIGRYFKLPTFVIGALIIGVGTSLPELAAAISAVLSGEPEIVVSNAVGSNITNILIVAGLSAVVARKIVSTVNLVNVEISLLALSTILFVSVAYDGIITQVEALIVFLSFFIYLSYLLFHREDSMIQVPEKAVEKLNSQDIAKLIGGSLLLFVGAKYLIEAVVGLSGVLSVSPELISISAVAVGTSLPEIIVSVIAVTRGKTDLAFGNVFGSNVFNMLMIVGSVGMFTALPVDPQTLAIGLPALVFATFAFIIASLSLRIYIWEGLMFLMLYFVFILKIFGLL